MRLIWAFNYSPAIDRATGNTIPVDIHNYTSVSGPHYHYCPWTLTRFKLQDITLAPRPFTVSIKPRSNQHVQIIDSAFADSTDVFASFEEGITMEDTQHLETLRAKQWFNLCVFVNGIAWMVYLQPTVSIKSCLQATSRLRKPVNGVKVKSISSLLLI